MMLKLSHVDLIQRTLEYLERCERPICMPDVPRVPLEAQRFQQYLESVLTEILTTDDVVMIGE